MDYPARIEAMALFYAGFTSRDRQAIKREYDFNDEDMAELMTELRKIEVRNERMLKHGKH